MNIPDIMLNIFKRKKKVEHIIRKKVDILSVKDDNRVDFEFAFAFDFIKGEDGKKKAIISINDDNVRLDEGQSCIFVMRSGDSDTVRVNYRALKGAACNSDYNVRDD